MSGTISTTPKVQSPFSEFCSSILKNKGAVIGLAIVFIFIFLAIFAPLISPHSPSIINADALRLPPAFIQGGHSSYPLGTDDVGRDTLSRLLHGARISLAIGSAIIFLSASIGTILGLLAGYLGGKTDWFIMRLVDIIMTFPSILLAIVVVSVMGPGIGNAVVAVAVVSIPSFVRIVRSSVINEKSKQYVMASKTFGASKLRIMFVEVLPNCLAPLIVQATLGFSDGILNTAALGFLGLGAQPPTPEWGVMLADARAYIQSSPWMVTLPGLCILLVVLGFNLFGDGLRDALDPRLKR